MISDVTSCEILPCYFSDHDSVDLFFDAKDVPSHGPGVWWLNLELLKDAEFCETIIRTISEHEKFQCYFSSLHDWWDFVKLSFKDIPQDFGKSKQQKLHRVKVNATNALIRAKLGEHAWVGRPWPRFLVKEGVFPQNSAEPDKKSSNSMRVV